MTRTATIERKTGRDRRAPDADARRQRRGHARDGRGLPRPHARPARAPRARWTSTCSVSGDLQTGAHHTAEDTAIVLGQALDAALGDRARHRPLRLGDRADGRGARELRDRHLRAPVHAVRGASCRRARPAASSTSSPRSSSARSPTPPSSRCTCAWKPGSNAHHMIEAAFKAFARALREAVAIDPTETGVPSTKGTLTVDEPARHRRAVEIAVVDYGMGNRRSVEKALEHVGARATVTQRPRAAARGRRPRRARRGRVPARDGATSRELGLDELLRERVGAGTPVLGDLPRHAARVRALQRAGRRRRARASSPGEVRALRPGELKLPHIGWNEVRFATRRLAAASPICRATLRLLPRALVRARARAPTRTSSATAEYGAPFVSAVEQRLASTACSSTPRSPPRPGCGCSPTSRASASAPRRLRPAGRRQVRLYPAIDILGGNAVRLVRATSTQRRSTTRTRSSAARGWVRAGARFLHVVDLDGAKGGEPVNLDAAASNRADARRAGAVRRRAAHAQARRRGARRRAPRA